MSIFKVYVSPDQPDIGDPGEPRIIADTFSWSALLVTPLWALGHRLWLVLTIWLVGTLTLILFATFVGGDLAFWLYVLGAIYVGFEASSLRGAKLAASGFVHRADLIAPDADLADLEWQKHAVAPTGAIG
jgi:hypothetical protein